MNPNEQIPEQKPAETPDELISPTVGEPSVPPTVLSPAPSPLTPSPASKPKISKKMLIILSVALLVVVGASIGGFVYYRQRQASARLAQEIKDYKRKAEEVSKKAAEEARLKAEAEAAAKKATTPTATTKTSPTKTPTTTTTQTAQKLGCGAGGSSGTGTTSSYLASNSYSPTTKMLAAIEFAGLKSQVDGKQVIVLTPNDYVFENKLTPSQLAWMNQSPANMKSVIGWHIITQCITYDGLNPTKDKANGTTISLTTLNGPITFTQTGYGKFENAEIAIWDFFTENGAVTFVTNFVKPPQVP